MQMISRGCTIERNIEGQWFLGIVLDVDLKEGTATIKYSDDGNVECEVLLDDVRISEERKHDDQQLSTKNSLSKPLAGLVEDDYEFRKNHQPTIFVHDNANTDETIVINGAENRVAAGGGLRALRYLKK